MCNCFGGIWGTMWLVVGTPAAAPTRKEPTVATAPTQTESTTDRLEAGAAAIGVSLDELLESLHIWDRSEQIDPALDSEITRAFDEAEAAGDVEGTARAVAMRAEAAGASGPGTFVSAIETVESFFGWLETLPEAANA